ncbi:hypothetical protein PAMP_013674 [Pampus punctatissimus]
MELSHSSDSSGITRYLHPASQLQRTLNTHSNVTPAGELKAGINHAGPRVEAHEWPAVTFQINGPGELNSSTLRDYNGDVPTACWDDEDKLFNDNQRTANGQRKERGMTCSKGHWLEVNCGRNLVIPRACTNMSATLYPCPLTAPMACTTLPSSPQIS